MKKRKRGDSKNDFIPILTHLSIVSVCLVILALFVYLSFEGGVLKEPEANISTSTVAPKETNTPLPTNTVIPTPTSTPDDWDDVEGEREAKVISNVGYIRLIKYRYDCGLALLGYKNCSHSFTFNSSKINSIVAEREVAYVTLRLNNNGREITAFFFEEPGSSFFHADSPRIELDKNARWCNLTLERRVDTFPAEFWITNSNGCEI